jgi:hypothetical protein
MFGTQILNNSSMGVNLAWEFNFHSVSFDYNGCNTGKCGAVGNTIGGGPAGPMLASFVQCHFEVFNGILLESPASAFQTYSNFSQSNLGLTAPSGNDVAFVQVGGTNSQAVFHRAGLYSGSAVSTFEASVINASVLLLGKTKQQSANQWAGVSACSNGTRAIAFPALYINPPAILVFDETTAGGAKPAARSLSGFTVSCAGASDAFSWVAIDNPG